jgi:hypothetical protein
VQKLLAAKGVMPAAFELLPNFPNPFNPSTSILFGVPASSRVRISVCTVLGQEVVVLVDGMVEQGYHTVEFDGRNRASGTYYVRMEGAATGAAQSFTTTRRIVLTK